jgi:hypothetical protein
MLFDNPTFSFSAIPPDRLGTPEAAENPLFSFQNPKRVPKKNLPHPVMPRPNKNHSAREADSRALAIESGQP